MKPIQHIAAETEVTMTKGYQEIKGVISYPTDSRFHFYVITLITGMKIVAGPSAFDLKGE
jgi:hypothetical protein